MMSEKRFTFGAVSPNVAMIKDNGEAMDIGEVVGLLNHFHQENNYLSTIRENQQQMILKLKEENEQLKHWNKCLAEKRHNEKESNENSIKN